MDFKSLNVDTGVEAFREIIDEALREIDEMFTAANTPAKMLIVIIAAGVLRDTKYRFRSETKKKKAKRR